MMRFVLIYRYKHNFKNHKTNQKMLQVFQKIMSIPTTLCEKTFLVCNARERTALKSVNRKDHLWIKGDTHGAGAGFWIKKQKSNECFGTFSEQRKHKISIVFNLNMEKNDILSVEKEIKNSVVLFLCCGDDQLGDFMNMLQKNKLVLTEICLVMPVKSNQMITHVQNGIIEMGFSLFLCLQTKLKYNMGIQQKWSNIWTYNHDDYSDHFVLNEDLLILMETFSNMLLQGGCFVNVVGKKKDLTFDKGKNNRNVSFL